MRLKIQGTYYPLTPIMTKKLRRLDLTAAEWRMWSLLIEKDSWGDRYCDLESLEVMTECNVSQATFYRAIIKFKEYGLFDFQDKGFQFKNHYGISKMRNDSQACESIVKNENAFSEMRNGFSKMRNDSQACENQPPDCPPDKNPGSPQIFSDRSDSLRVNAQHEQQHGNYKKQEREKISQENDCPTEQQSLKHPSPNYQDKSKRNNEQRDAFRISSRVPSHNSDSLVAKDNAEVKRKTSKGFGQKQQTAEFCSTVRLKIEHIKTLGLFKTLRALRYKDLPFDKYEEFIEWARKRVDSLPRRPESPDAWVLSQLDSLLAEFKYQNDSKRQQEDQLIRNRDALAEHERRKELFYAAFEKYLAENGLEHNFRNEEDFKQNIWSNLGAPSHAEFSSSGSHRKMSV